MTPQQGCRYHPQCVIHPAKGTYGCQKCTETAPSRHRRDDGNRAPGGEVSARPFTLIDWFSALCDLTFSNAQKWAKESTLSTSKTFTALLRVCTKRSRGQISNLCTEMWIFRRSATSELLRLVALPLFSAVFNRFIASCLPQFVFDAVHVGALLTCIVGDTVCSVCFDYCVCLCVRVSVGSVPADSVRFRDVFTPSHWLMCCVCDVSVLCLH